LGFCRNYFKAKTALAYPELGEKGCEPTKENKQQTKKKIMFETPKAEFFKRIA